MYNHSKPNHSISQPSPWPNSSISSPSSQLFSRSPPSLRPDPPPELASVSTSSTASRHTPPSTPVTSPDPNSLENSSDNPKHASHTSNTRPECTLINPTSPPSAHASSARPQCTSSPYLSIGTEDAEESYYLGMDTASGLTWTQCVPCEPCFPQSSPVFNPELSPSFAFLPCDDPLCAEPYECLENLCTFSISYLDDSNVAGVISREAFAFETSTGNPEIVQGLAFGCTHVTSELVGFDGDGHGILGLDASPQSFVTQLGPRAGGRFSYCLLPFVDTDNNYLRFGDDIMMNGPVQRTPFEAHNGFYYLGMNDLSINGQHLNIPSGTFDPCSDGSGGGHH